MSTLEITKGTVVNRRQFLATTGGLLLAFSFEDNHHAAEAQGLPGTQVTGFVRIGADESITVLVGGGEMGQGIYSGLAQGVAEELMVDWETVQVGPVAAGLSWLSGGSTGIRRRLTSMRTAGAAAREMLIAAAAEQWGVLPSVCSAAHGMVTNSITSETLSYGSLAVRAAAMPVPSAPPLVPSSAFRIIGTSVARPDLPSKTDGSAIFGLDVMLPDMLFAVVKHCPVFGGTLRSTPPRPPGATHVVPLGNAVAVVATNTWQAMEAARKLEARWNFPAGYLNIDSAVIRSQAQNLIVNGPAVVAESRGDVAGAFAGAASTFQRNYYVPYLAHCCMEVLSATVHYDGETCDIYAPTQAPNAVLGAAKAVTGLPADKINVVPTFMGGGLGRKFEVDYITQALKIGMALRKPVKLMWPRPEDMQHDQYRPMALVRVRAAMDASGNITGWAARTATPSILGQRGPLPPSGVDSQAVEGLVNLSYGFGSRLIEFARHPALVPVGFWRSVGASINGFVTESAIDEIALATGADPVVLRRRLLAADPRSLAVLNAAAELGEWFSPVPPGRARGIALVWSFGSIVAEVAEISVPVAGTIKVHRVSCAVDCGMAINPNSVEAQMQGGITHGLSAALWGEVPMKAGRATTRNFSNYRVLQMRESPQVDVRIINSGAPLGGIGEPGVPPIAPALANAYARLTGRRVRSLPFFPGATMGDD